MSCCTDFRSGIFVVPLLRRDASPLSPQNPRPHHPSCADCSDGPARDDTVSLHIATTTLALRLLYMAVTGGRISPEHPTGVEKLYWSLVLAQDILLVTNTVFTDGLLIYRCYHVWGRPNKIFLAVPILLMLATLATGYVTSYDEDKYADGWYHFDPRVVFTLNLFTNLVLMMLTAGRIWWVTRRQRAVLGAEWTPRYNAAIAIILESGAIYCSGLIFQVVALSFHDSALTASIHLHGTIGQLVNIVPTLIVVRGWGMPPSILRQPRHDRAQEELVYRSR
ncbi:hypothetical protein B0H14DRAFT_573145 [Mycena olivaceomarginata]|nr:hypothetical protein B0H14DRAFT_573145 [Mycena olivaceomarginata]